MDLTQGSGRRTLHLLRKQGGSTMRPFIISSDSIRILASGGAIALLSMCSAALPSAPASAAEPSTTLSIQPTPKPQPNGR